MWGDWVLGFQHTGPDVAQSVEEFLVASVGSFGVSESTEGFPHLPSLTCDGRRKACNHAEQDECI